MRYIAISLVVLIFSFFGILNPIRGAYANFITPLQLGLRTIARSSIDTFIFFENIENVHRENLELSQLVIDLEAALTELRGVQEENMTLREQLGIEAIETLDVKDLVLANVMGNPNDSTGASLYIDKGIKDGVSVGANVISGKYLVGIIRQAGPKRSLVELVTSPGVSATVYDINSPGKPEGLAIGQYGSFVMMQRILPEEQVLVGDVIVTSGKDGFFYPDFIIGKVSEISQDPAQPLKTANIEVLVDLAELKKVFVLGMD
ncbi:rod shape-determining protein MreC [bacterium]|nr:rod shape-determining protein MreC [bacterium]